MPNHLTGHLGYRASDIILLTDDSRDPRRLPTKTNMINAMQWLVHNAMPHDALFFHFSGHGGQTRDLDGDEVDGYDERTVIGLFPVFLNPTTY
jgi:metacaspase-1